MTTATAVADAHGASRRRLTRTRTTRPTSYYVRVAIDPGGADRASRSRSPTSRHSSGIALVAPLLVVMAIKFVASPSTSCTSSAIDRS